MSGGERKKRDKAQGWEEAGAEFYQENYPKAVDADLQQALQDPSNIATLLPSKKSRVATTTAKRIRHEARTTLRRRTSSRSYYASTARRMSMNLHDAAVSMLPDLSENLSNEESTWEEIMQIKSMPVCMAQKIQLKKQLQNATKLRLQGLEQLKWRQRKLCQLLRIKSKEIYSKIELWRSSLQSIRGNFGIGITTYFLFIKWILFLNLFLFSLILLFLVLPSVLLDKFEPTPCNVTEPQSVACCSNIYYNDSSTRMNGLKNLTLGMNLFSHSLIFYDGYGHETYATGSSRSVPYNMPLAYLCTMAAVYVISLMILFKCAAKGFHERVAESEGQYYQYCNLVFGGWDYCISNEKASAIKHRAIYNEFKLYLESERLEDERQGRTIEEKLKLYSTRVFVNLMILLLLGFCATFLYYITDLSFKNLSDRRNDTNVESITNISIDILSQLFFEFLPYVYIVCINILVPLVLRNLISLEHYSPLFVSRVMLVRALVLRFCMLAVFIFTIYKTVVIKNDNSNCEFCWETFVGQQFVKLYLTDLTGQFFVTFFVNLPRSLLGRTSENKLMKFIGQQTFNLPKHVLDIVYSQTICWLGCFFSPFLPLLTVLGTFFLFYIKKFSCLVNSTPSVFVYKASRSNSLFMLVLLVSYVFSMTPIIYYFVKLNPSKSCGPFKDLPTVGTLVVSSFWQLPDVMRLFFCFLTTPAFGLPVLGTFILLTYYYRIVSKTNRQMVGVLKNQLVLEGHDKQFLLNRLSAFIKQQQDQTKCHQETNDLSTFT